MFCGAAVQFVLSNINYLEDRGSIEMSAKLPSFLPIQIVVSFLIAWGASYSDPVLAQEPGAKVSKDVWGVVVERKKAAEIVKFFDENGDGKIDLTEYTLRIVAYFIKLDKNDDDFVTPDEVPTLEKRAFDEMDQNKDGKISGYEFATAKSLNFEKIDTNKDGFITVDEVAAYLAKRHKMNR